MVVCSRAISTCANDTQCPAASSLHAAAGQEPYSVLVPRSVIAAAPRRASIAGAGNPDRFTIDMNAGEVVRGRRRPLVGVSTKSPSTVLMLAPDASTMFLLAVSVMSPPPSAATPVLLIDPDTRRLNRQAYVAGQVDETVDGRRPGSAAAYEHLAGRDAVQLCVRQAELASDLRSQADASAGGNVKRHVADTRVDNTLCRLNCDTLRLEENITLR